MLAQNLETAEELGLNDAEHGALVNVLGMLERGELVHLDTFNMNNWCGTACCIGGWAEKIGGMTGTNSLRKKALGGFDVEEEKVNLGLARLFYPPDPNADPDDTWDCMDEKAMKSITPTQSATALRNYLTTGDPNWAEALS